MKKLIEVKNLSKEYGDYKALDKVSFSLPEKGFIFINGVSGSGKTTLINMMMGMDSPSEGQVVYRGKELSGFSSDELDEYRNINLGIVFQSFNLIDDISVRENLLLPLKIQEYSVQEREALVEEAIEYVGLKEYYNHLGYELSAGQKQRIAIARAIVKKPKIIFADEATGNLDARNTEQILRLLNDISKTCLVVLISHNDISAQKYGDRIITLSEGKVIKDVDNRKLKMFYHDPYRITVKGEDYEKEMNLAEFDFKEELKWIAEKQEKRIEKYNLKTTVIYDESLKKEEVHFAQKNNLRSRGLSFRDVWGMAVKVFKRKKSKNVSALILIVFTIVFLLLTANIYINDYSLAEIKYLSDNSNTMYKVEKKVYGENMSNTYHFGKQINTELQNIASGRLAHEIDDDVVLVDNMEETFSIFIKGQVFTELPLEGKWPEKDSEIVISRKTAEDTGYSIGSTIMLFTGQSKVVGIVDISKYYSGYCGIVWEEFKREKMSKERYLNFEACNIVQSTFLPNYVESICAVGSNTELKKENLIWGRMPENKNEVIISSRFAKTNGFNLKNGFVTKYRLPDIHDAKYNLEYDAKMNLFDYFGKNVDIVGVYKNNEYYGDILVSADIYNKMISDELNYYIPREIFICFAGQKEEQNEELGGETKDDYNRKLLKVLEENGFQLDERICDFIISTKLTIEHIWFVFALALLIIYMIVISVLNSTLVSNVKESYKLIGVYKALGISNKDVTKIYLLVNMGILLAGIVISCTLCVILNIALNRIIDDLFLSQIVDVFILRWPMLFLLVLLVIISAIICTVMPMRKLLKNDLIKLINREDY